MLAVRMRFGYIHRPKLFSKICTSVCWTTIVEFKMDTWRHSICSIVCVYQHSRFHCWLANICEHNKYIVVSHETLEVNIVKKEKKRNLGPCASHLLPLGPHFESEKLCKIFEHFLNLYIWNVSHSAILNMPLVLPVRYIERKGKRMERKKGNCTVEMWTFLYWQNVNVLCTITAFSVCCFVLCTLCNWLLLYHRLLHHCFRRRTSLSSSQIL